jgi:tetrahydrodipicolinate N-succinyltransferase
MDRRDEAYDRVGGATLLADVEFAQEKLKEYEDSIMRGEAKENDEEHKRLKKRLEEEKELDRQNKLKEAKFTKEAEKLDAQLRANYLKRTGRRIQEAATLRRQRSAEA